MTVTFQVGDREFGGSGNLDIDFWVCRELVLVLMLTNKGKRTADPFSIPGRGPPSKPPVLQASHFIGRLLVHRAHRRPILLLLQQ